MFVMEQKARIRSGGAMDNERYTPEDVSRFFFSTTPVM